MSIFVCVWVWIRLFDRWNESFTLGKIFSLEKWFDSGIIGQRMVCLCQKHCSIIVLAVCNGFNALSFTLTIQTTHCECQMTDQLWEVHHKIVNIERIIVWSTLIIFERGWWRERKKGRGGAVANEWAKGDLRSNIAHIHCTIFQFSSIGTLINFILKKCCLSLFKAPMGI